MDQCQELSKKCPKNDPLSVKWAEKYDEQLKTIWNRIPEPIKNVLVFSAIFALGISINGDWITIWVHMCRQMGYMYIQKPGRNDTFKDFWKFFLSAHAVSFVIYFGVGGFVHWYYYVRQRDRPEEWKCQPRHFMNPELERHELIFGSFTLFLNGTTSSILACYIANGGYSTVYYNYAECGWTWFFLQFAVIFIYQDYLTYWMHRIFHTPWLYKNFHKLHHKYKYPTAWSVTAIHPVESLFIQLVLSSPLFLFPVHWLAFYIVAIYTYYHGIIDHSGVNFKSYWWQPWQPDAIFHDNHHQYFHVNFGFNIYIWDVLHGTYRQKDRIYHENVFYGKGKSFSEASQEEIEGDVEERNSENPLAYRNNELEYQLDSSDLDKKCYVKI